MERWAPGMVRTSLFSNYSVYPQLVTGIPSLKSDLRGQGEVEVGQTMFQPTFKDSCYKKLFADCLFKHFQHF
jgi:hypothetical protein